MSLLVLEDVSRGDGHPRHRRVLLRQVSLRLDEGELVAVWGLRRSGRSTLLRVAAGIEPPDSGVVRFAGQDLTRAAGDLLGSQLAYCARASCATGDGNVLDELTAVLLARGAGSRFARRRAWSALERAGAEGCAGYGMRELDSAEETRVAIARGLLSEPRLLLIDEPIKGVDLLARDGVLALIRSLADERIAILMSTGDAAALSIADRALSLSDGELRGALSPELASVVSLPLRASA
jgi:ABC-type multidrug transport system ATPase subunit